MSDVHSVSREIGGRTLTIETGRIARQAGGAVMVRYGETIVLVAATCAPPRFEDIDFFPLSVDYRERHSAAGKFPGGFIKREGRPTTKEILTARMIDRPIRPLFPDGYFQEVQIMASVLSADQDNDPDVPAMIGASAALCISSIPFQGPIGTCRVGRINGEFVVNPTYQQLAESDINVLVGGRKEAINMLEVGAKELAEDVVAQAIRTGHEAAGQVIEMIEELQQKVGVEKVIPLTEIDAELEQKIRAEITEPLRELKTIQGKRDRNDAVNALLDEVKTRYCGEEAGEAKANPGMVKRILGKIECEVVRQMILEGKRPDGRGYDQVRPISCEVGLLPRTHGSALFTRGETQALISVTLGTIRDAQIIDGLMEEYSQSFTYHYNFPPFSVGEVKPIRGPGRREIGHGALAERALENVRPSSDKFAYTVRLISDITESNGSSSMASVCGGSLALMDAGVPINGAVAGISVGMISGNDGRYELLTDIIGEEDHFGDMDFKVAGTSEGITAIQLDIKAEGLPHQIMVEALERARNARLHILEIMNKAISTPRAELSQYAPKLITVEIDPEFIGKVIGPGGKMIKSLQEQTNTTIEIEEDGTVFISCVGGDGHLKAKALIEAMTKPPEVGRLYKDSKVVSIKDFGMFVEIAPGVEGLCHISELSDGYVKQVDDVCKLGDIVPVKLISIDDQGRLKLSRRAALAELGIKEEKRPRPHEKR
ncbi:MAG: polyribonucleotide nucleotidyltransferase [Sedimentisphaerales bacterium]|jgi:polyribonucleotide nucleotidyltransferase|nr:polyribonucleotide nucleotidyltransferase [Planctomycetota bacterium]MDY0356750.1 polyribonucleotide nucleotidyltransferase [Sedimentisphaerales bacterium]NLT76357.1 polyribonucleotide nucleotidyltransferase [Planctomycetota bacterium]